MPKISRRVPSGRACASLFAVAFLALGAQAQTPASSGSNRPAAPSLAPTVLNTELAGRTLGAYPWFEYVRSFHAGEPVWCAIDPTRFPWIAGTNCEIWLVQPKSGSGWAADPLLVDVRGAPQTVTFGSGSIQSCTFQLDTGTLYSDGYDELGVGYEVVIDLDRDGELGVGDTIDGLGSNAGFYVVRDPAQPGPHPVTEILYSGGSLLGQNTFYPSDIALLGVLPLVVVSHGNGHNYQWYDHIGAHLASWGFVVMSHQNNTQPGVESASTTTLTNTDYFLGHLDSIAGGALQEHIDAHKIVFIGHSRGGEGVVRAYNRVVTGQYVPQSFAASDVVLVSSIAPTSFLLATNADIQSMNYHLFVGASDSDVTGGANNLIAQSFPLYERGRGNKHSMSLQGAGHADFHNGTGPCWCTGPNLIGKAGTHPVVRGYYLPLCKYYTNGSLPSLDFFTRMNDDFRPQGIPANVVIATEYREARTAGTLVLEDFQTNPALDLSSADTAVTATVSNLVEGLMRDDDGSFAFNAAVPMNGMTRWRDGVDDPRCAVFDFQPAAPGVYEVELPLGSRDLRAKGFLSFRACQGTRHPETDLLDAPVSFSVSLVDDAGTASRIDFGVYGRLTRTYERSGLGLGTGWANEFGTVRVRLTDFLNDGSGLDMSNVRAVRFEFGPGFGSDRGRIGIDDIEITKKGH